MSEVPFSQEPFLFSLSVAGPTAVTTTSVAVTTVDPVPRQPQELAVVTEEAPMFTATELVKPSRSYSRGTGGGMQRYENVAVVSDFGEYGAPAGVESVVPAMPHERGMGTVQPRLTRPAPAMTSRTNAEHTNTVMISTPSAVTLKAVASTAVWSSDPASSSVSRPYQSYGLLLLCFRRWWPWRAWRVCDSGLRGGHSRHNSTGDDDSAHLLCAATAEPRYRVDDRSGRDDDDYHNGGPVKFLHRLSMALGRLSFRTVRQEGSGGRAPCTTSAATRCRRRGVRGMGMLLRDGARIFLTFLLYCCCCCCCPFVKKLAGETTRRRNSVIVVAANTTESVILVISRAWGQHRGLILLATACALVSWFGAPLAQAAFVWLWESEELFLARMHYVGLPDALRTPTHPIAVLLQQPIVPPALVSLPRVSALSGNDGGGGASERETSELEVVQKSLFRKLYEGYRTRSAMLAMEGLRLSYVQRHPRLFFFLSTRTLTRSQVPSWTLHVVEDGCAECLQGQGYAEALERAAAELNQTSSHAAEDNNVSGEVPLQVQGAVFATSNAPLGRIGPMLLAMASVTDDVEVALELRKWRWLASVRASEVGKDSPGVRRGSSKHASHTPYLAVLGIPSTDQPARIALREAQRQTWLTYHEVARAETGFDGALLPLYIFGAVERPALTRQPTGTPLKTSAPGDGEGADREKGRAAGTPSQLDGAYVSVDSQRLSTNPSLLLPRIDELAAAVELRTATLAATARATIATDEDASLLEMPTITQRRRRMTLRPSWRRERSMDSPCDVIVDRTVTMTETSATPPSLPLLQVANDLSLPVTPLFTSPARLVCYASSALWQEALEHRDTLWIDMLTDRRPTTGKTIGGEGKWGLRAEVGMSQKLILWLMYAYCNFPEVPFIMKGDDDTYIKVPQYLSDIRYLRRGRKTREPPPHDMDREHTTAVNEQLAIPTEECLYWGSMRRWNGELYFGAGMLFLLHRRLVQTVVELRTGFNNDVLYLAASDYSAAYAHSYYANMMDHEDVMLGKLLRERRFRADELCPFRRHWYVWEDLHRFHDLHSGRVHNVTWASVTLHRCRPADAHYLHYFFAQEYRYSGRGGVAEGGSGGDLALHNERAEHAARQAAQSWVAERLGRVLQASSDDSESAARKFRAPSFTDAEKEAGWSSLPDVRWALQRDRSVHTPPYLSARDGVAINDVEYIPFTDGVLLPNGWKARILL
ncbi:phosphoglycan beta 1,3 galactosyltransferase 1 [Leishmania tarentolae]|uniref:Phosphoglycan beta 1,3 galactosyltransferase 1 n=1 Tax=Leishmania tarentolae TaxID=5689 RepID=A0A640KDP1_LEITA|nr:phosphoglycan beta 1,3 galactosyltransferase 1 [Leishmania tarentolae]